MFNDHMHFSHIKFSHVIKIKAGSPGHFQILILHESKNQLCLALHLLTFFKVILPENDD